MLGEPTNDLDIETLTQLEDVLDGWAGTLLVVSHDRYLLERLCDRQVALLGDGKVRDMPGGVDQYLELRARPLSNNPIKGPAPEKGSGVRGTDPGGAKGETVASAGAGASPAEVRDARKVMARVEKQLQRLSEREDRLHTQMAEAAADHARVLELNRELREIVDEREALELEWLEAADVVG